MPFRSKAQQRYMYANNPKLAEEFAQYMDSKDFKSLPEKSSGKNKKKKSKKKTVNKKKKGA